MVIAQGYNDNTIGFHRSTFGVVNCWRGGTGTPDGWVYPLYSPGSRVAVLHDDRRWLSQVRSCMRLVQQQQDQRCSASAQGGAEEHFLLRLREQQIDRLIGGIRSTMRKPETCPTTDI